jgi:hypothetical protein
MTDEKQTLANSQQPKSAQDSVHKEWPQEILDLAGAWPDFPTLEEIRAFNADDVPREALDE